MTADDLDPERADMLRRKYINLEPTLENAAVIIAEAEHERAIREARQACEDYNEANGLAWINWELPTELRERVYQVRARLREAQARDAREGDGPPSVWYDDDRNKFDEAYGWPAYNPDKPHHQTVPFGTIVAEPNGCTCCGAVPLSLCFRPELCTRRRTRLWPSL